VSVPRRKLEAVLVAAGAVVVLLAVPGSASALKTRSVTTTTIEDGLLTAQANCKQGERVVSGGFSSQEEAWATESRAIKKRGWTVSLFPGVPPPQASLTVDAYCAKKGRFSKRKRTEDAPPTPDDPVLSTAKCDPGKRAISGGYTLESTTDGDNSPVFISRRARKRAWTVSAFIDDPPGTLTTFAYCRQSGKVKVRSKQSEPIQDSEQGSATAKCHRGETLLSGGYTTTPESDFNNTTGPDFFYYVSSRSGPRSWTAAAHNYSAVAGQITTYAYCKP
jgi:hypothetical protein